MFRFPRVAILPIAAAGCLLMTACGSAAGASSAAGSTPVATTSSSASTSASSVVQKVNANTASQAELQAAFAAAGISNPAQWAREVTEYRPYPTDDPTFSKLRGELAKYNPGQATVDSILATLSL